MEPVLNDGGKDLASHAEYMGLHAVGVSERSTPPEHNRWTAMCGRGWHTMVNVHTGYAVPKQLFSWVVCTHVSRNVINRKRVASECLMTWLRTIVWTHLEMK